MNFLSLFTRRASILGLGAALAGWGIVFFAALDGSGQPALAFARIHTQRRVVTKSKKQGKTFFWA